jgi:hypothetical protein
MSGSSNRNPKTGIRYGVVGQNKMNSILFEVLTAVFDDEDEGVACQHEVVVEDFRAFLTAEGLLWVFESKWVMPCMECSPCMPDAGNLSAWDEYGEMAYCPPPWYWLDAEYGHRAVLAADCFVSLCPDDRENNE